MKKDMEKRIENPATEATLTDATLTEAIPAADADCAPVGLRGEPERTRRLLRLLAACLLAVCLLLTFYADWKTSGELLDGDASGILVIAHRMAEEHSLLPASVSYGQAFDLLGAQLVYAPLFYIFSDWRMVRLTGTILLQLLLLAAYGFLCRRLKRGRAAFCAGGALLMLPFGILYGRFVLFHVNFLPQIAKGFCMAALLLGALETERGRERRVLNGALYCALAFLTGIGGLTRLMNAVLPLFLAAVGWTLLCERGDGKPALRSEARRLGWTAAGCASGGAGWALSRFVLAGIYRFGDGKGAELVNWEASGLSDIVNEFVRVLGWQRGYPLVSVRGVLSLSSLVLAVCLIAACILGLRSLREKGGEGFLRLNFLAALVLCLGLLSVSGEAWPDALYIPAAAWGVACLPGLWGDAPVNLRNPRLSRLVLCAMALVLLANGARNDWFFSHSQTDNLAYPAADLGYSTYGETKTTAELRDVVAFLLENGCELGCAPEAEANVIAELSNGAIAVCTVDRYDEFSGEFSAGCTGITDLNVLSTPLSDSDKMFFIENRRDSEGIPAGVRSRCRQAMICGRYTIFVPIE